MKNRLKFIALASLAFGAGVAITPAVPAIAVGDPTTITFAPSATQTVPYGTNWVMPITVSAADLSTIDGSDGTVDIVIDGQPGTYATGLPLAPGGVAFFSPPSSKPPLASGTYQVHAIYQPSGPYYAASQTTTAAVLTITPLKLLTSFTLKHTTVHNKPSASVLVTLLQLTTRPSPSGVWQVIVTPLQGKRSAYSLTAAVPAGKSADTTIRLGSAIKPGGKYTVAAIFRPAATVAGGYAVTDGKPQLLKVSAQTLTQILDTSVAVSTTFLLAIAVGFLMLVSSAIVFLVRSRKRQRPTEAVDAHSAIAIVED